MNLRWWLWVVLVVGSATPIAAEERTAANDPQVPWTIESRNDDPVTGYVFYKRIPSGSKFAAYRLEAEIDAPPEAVARAARARLLDPDEHQARMRKEILSDDGDVAIVYSYIDMPPFITDRDIVTRAERLFDAETRSYRLEWHTTDEGPPPRDGVIRVQKSDGSWVFEPLQGGRTRVIYESHTEIAGALPGWLVNSLMNDTVIGDFQGLRARAIGDAQSGG